MKWNRKDLELLRHNRPLILALYDELSRTQDKCDNVDLSHEAEKFNLIETINKFKGKKDHPEDYCHRCEGRNINWHTDNGTWNDLAYGIICPICLDELHKEKHGNSPHWKIIKS